MATLAIFFHKPCAFSLDAVCAGQEGSPVDTLRSAASNQDRSLMYQKCCNEGLGMQGGLDLRLHPSPWGGSVSLRRVQIRETRSWEMDGRRSGVAWTWTAQQNISHQTVVCKSYDLILVKAEIKAEYNPSWRSDCSKHQEHFMEYVFI